jgi:DNA gyrase inhibitor GyrI
MTKLDVRIERLEPMRVAAVRVISQTPERDAWEIMQAWAQSRGLLDDIQSHPVFGFNNPPPQPDSKEYGYEFWIRVSPEAKATSQIEIKDFPGGLYAVTTCQGFPNPQLWMSLWQWVKSSEYKWRKTHELEKPHNPLASENDMVFDLYLPVEQ